MKRETSETMDLAPDIGATGLRVLLVEDEPVNAMLAETVLRELSCDVTVANDGVQALDAALHDVFDVILMDVRMPMMDGLETTRLLIRVERAIGRRHTPVVAVTGSAMRGEVQQCLDAGMDDVLIKPYLIADLAGAVVRWGRSCPPGAATRGSLLCTREPQCAGMSAKWRRL